MDSETSDVLIIGGGVSGLFAAYTLVQSGIPNVTLLEANDRHGGRIHTVGHSEGGVLDLGAQWIHGKGDNPLWKFILENNIPISEDYGGDGDGAFYLPGGKIVEKKILKDTLEFLEEIHDFLDEFSIGEVDNENIPISVGHFFEARFGQFLEKLDEDEGTTIVRKALFDWFMKWEVVDTGTDDLKDQSVLSWGEYIDYDFDSSSDSESECESDPDEESEEREPILRGGYYQLIAFLIRQLEGKVRILTGETVEKICWGQDIATVFTESGDSFNSSHVLLTVSLGVLKYSHKSLFSPALPDSKIEAIEKMGMGLLNKIMLEFDDKFWNETDPGIQLVHPNPNMEDDISLTWMNHIAGFDKVVDQPRMLGALISGAAARHIETLSEQQILMKCWELLKQFVGPSVPKPKSCRTSSWYSNRYYRGSYSYRPPACDQLDIGPWSLASPVGSKQGKPQLLFGGEATDMSSYGTVTGAMVAGIREGERLVKLLGSN